MKKLISMIFLIICNNLSSQNINNEMYNEALQMLQSGNVNQAGMQKMYDSFSKEYDKKTENTMDALSKQYGDFNYNLGYNKAKSNLHLDAIENYNTAIQHKPTFEAYNSKGCSQYALGDYTGALESFNKALEFQSDNQTAIQNKLNAQQQILKVEYAPIAIYDIKIANSDQEGNIVTDYDLPIYSDNTYYLKPKIFYKSNVKSKVSLQLKYFKSDGSLIIGDTSHEGYSTKVDLITNGDESRSLIGWGSKTKGNWATGRCRLEIWYEDVCIASKNFFILPDVHNDNNVTMPNYFPPQNNENSSGLTLKRKVCTSCNGKGVDPYPSYAPTYGLDRVIKDEACPICGRHDSHYHKSCIPCQGKGYIESY